MITKGLFVALSVSCIITSIVLAYIIFISTGEIIRNLHSDCTISLNHDLGEPQPLILRIGKFYGNDAFYLPDTDGDIVFGPNEEILLDCPGSQLLLSGQSLGKSSAVVKCFNGRSFTTSASSNKYDIKVFTCSQQVQNIAKDTGNSCMDEKQEIDISYNVSDGRILNIINICFDPKKETTLYSKYNLTSRIVYNQKLPNNPMFKKTFFDDNVEDLYKFENQTNTINGIVGLTPDSDEYISKKQSLTRGHLTAKADFVYSYQKRATFYYVNAAPQWRTINNGNWKAIVQDVRSFAINRKMNLIVYTGTHGVATLSHNKTEGDAYLYLYNNKNKFRIPVPQIFWKVLYDPKTKAGVSFVSVNNPYRKSDDLCDNICDQLESWKLSWKPNNITYGYSYCCAVDDLKKKVKNIPDLEIDYLLT